MAKNIDSEGPWPSQWLCEDVFEGDYKIINVLDRTLIYGCKYQQFEPVKSKIDNTKRYLCTECLFTCVGIGGYDRERGIVFLAHADAIPIDDDPRTLFVKSIYEELQKIGGNFNLEVILAPSRPMNGMSYKKYENRFKSSVLETPPKINVRNLDILKHSPDRFSNFLVIDMETWEVLPDDRRVKVLEGN